MLRYKLLSSLDKPFLDSKLDDFTPLRKLTMLRNERISVQLVLTDDSAAAPHRRFVGIKIEGVFAPYATKRTLESVPSAMPASPGRSDENYLRTTPGLYPDLLAPMQMNGSAACVPGQLHSVWIDIDPMGALPAGNYNLTVVLSDGAVTERAQLAVEVIAADLPEQALRVTEWFHCDCLATYYKVDVFSEEHWRIIENYVKNAAAHGINFILTPLFTPPLDTEVGGERPTVQLVDVKKTKDGYEFGFDRLDRWIDMCKRCGIKYFEMSHLFTQWGAEHAPKIIAEVDGEEKRIFGWETDADSAEYCDFLRRFAAALTAFIDKKGIRNFCRFHVSDEPSLEQYETYKKRADIIAEIFPGFKVIDALSDIEFFDKGAVKYPIPSEDHVEDFVGKVDEIWTYYCCGQHNKDVPNRFFAMPSARNRILGALLYKYNAVGFLQWGYNFWYSQFSKHEIDPFTVTDAGKAFPSGDAFVVYPGENGQPLNSLRLKVFYDGLQDFAAMRLLESLVGREKALEIIVRDDEFSFLKYPHGSSYLIALRERVNQAIKENI